MNDNWIYYSTTNMKSRYKKALRIDGSQGWSISVRHRILVKNTPHKHSGISISCHESVNLFKKLTYRHFCGASDDALSDSGKFSAHR